MEFEQGSPSSPFDRLVAIMARLRDPADGCEWDRAQDFASIAPYTIEEAYEVADAIARGDIAAARAKGKLSGRQPLDGNKVSAALKLVAASVHRPKRLASSGSGGRPSTAR